MWELPSLEGSCSREEVEGWLQEQGAQVRSLETLPESKHIFTHVEWHMRAFGAELAEPLPGFFWADPQSLEETCALPSAFKAYFPLLGLQKS